MVWDGCYNQSGKNIVNEKDYKSKSGKWKIIGLIVGLFILAIIFKL